jgi:hypothetical protein
MNSLLNLFIDMSIKEMSHLCKNCKQQQLIYTFDNKKINAKCRICWKAKPFNPLQKYSFFHKKFLKLIEIFYIIVLFLQGEPYIQIQTDLHQLLGFKRNINTIYKYVHCLRKYVKKIVDRLLNTK